MTLDAGLQAVREGKIVVGSIDANGNFSMSASPVAHSFPSEARAECRRLAKLYPGKAFIMLTLEGAELVPHTTISI